jgi:hypothetical protein
MHANNRCLTDGRFSHWTSLDGFCLYRGGKRRLDSLYAPEHVDWIINYSTDYEDFRENFEQTAHAAVHFVIDGLMATVHIFDVSNEQDWSPDDPLFFVHHSNIDRIWFGSTKLTKGMSISLRGRTIKQAIQIRRSYYTLSSFPYTRPLTLPSLGTATNILPVQVETQMH